MRIGKLTNKQLKDIVLSKLKQSENVLLSSAVGEDCAALRFGDEACVLTTDPITGASENVGTLAVHVSCNDIASSGARPEAMLVTLLVPPDRRLEDVETVVDELIQTADALGISIIGGHTEVTDAVTRIVVSTTVIGRTTPEKLITSSGACAGDVLIMTKTAALEGTYILASDKEDKLRNVLKEEELREAQSLDEQISVVPEGVVAVRSGATAMHDVTEGGVFGAVHELCEASGVGCTIEKDEIPMLDVTRKIADHFSINPYRLIGSGSMLITTHSPAKMLDAFKKAQIEAAVIGVITSGKVLLSENGMADEITPPEADELFSV